MLGISVDVGGVVLGVIVPDGDVGIGGVGVVLGVLGEGFGVCWFVG